MPAKNRTKPQPSTNGTAKPKPTSANRLLRTDPIPAFEVDDSQASSSKRRELQPYIRSLLTGCPYDIDNLDHPECTGIFGRQSAPARWTDDDADGIPILTDFLRKSYDWQIECWERECRELLARYGCGIDPRDPVPSPPPDEASDVENDAYWLIVAAQGMKRRLRVGDFFGSIMFAVELGSLKRKIQARWADGTVDRGRRQRKKMNDLKGAYERLCGKRRDRREVALSTYQRELEKGATVSDAVESAASAAGVTPRTIFRYLEKR